MFQQATEVSCRKQPRVNWSLPWCVAVAIAMPSLAPAEPPGGKTQRPSADVLFSCNFESDTWYEEWGTRRRDGHAAVVAADPVRKFRPLQGKALRIKVDRGGHYGLSVQFRFKKQLGEEPEEIYFRYYLRFADDWNPVRGGKLPGIAGTYGRAGWGGRRVNGRDGWSARGLFSGQRNGKTPIGFYCYHADMRGRYGSNWVWEKDRLGYLENNRWYCIEQYARMNTPGRNDGVLRGWVDGRLAFEKTDVRMRHVDSLKIESVWLNIYLGGTWTSRSEHHLYIDNVVISQKYIAPIAKEEDRGNPRTTAMNPCPHPWTASSLLRAPCHECRQSSHIYHCQIVYREIFNLCGYYKAGTPCPGPGRTRFSQSAW